MYPRTDYEMTEEDLATLLDSMKPQPVIKIGSHWTGDRQESANAAWAALGQKMGFDHMTVRPTSGKGNRFFTAVPSETEEARTVRLAREADKRRQQEVERLTSEISERQEKLAALTKTTP